MVLKVIGIVGMICTLTACATTGKYQTELNTLKGQPVESVLAKWGEPRGDVILDNGDRLLTYIRTRSIQLPGAVGISPSPIQGVSPGIDFGTRGSGTDTLELRCMTKFYLHDDLVQHWTIDGNDCIYRGDILKRLPVAERTPASPTPYPPRFQR